MDSREEGCQASEVEEDPFSGLNGQFYAGSLGPKRVFLTNGLNGQSRLDFWVLSGYFLPIVDLATSISLSSYAPSPSQFQDLLKPRGPGSSRPTKTPRAL